MDTAASGNAKTFGFSILITVSYGILARSAPAPSIGQQFGFVMAERCGVCLLNPMVAYLTRREAIAPESQRVVLVATATDFVAVGVGLGAAYGIDLLLGGWAAWLVTPLVPGSTYILVQTLELVLGRMDIDEG